MLGLSSSGVDLGDPHPVAEVVELGKARGIERQRPQRVLVSGASLREDGAGIRDRDRLRPRDEAVIAEHREMIGAEEGAVRTTVELAGHKANVVGVDDLGAAAMGASAFHRWALLTLQRETEAGRDVEN